jgi:hypothetical protein
VAPLLEVEDLTVQYCTGDDVGRPGGRLVVALRTEPQTLNPVTAVDNASSDVRKRMSAGLIEIQPDTQGASSAP